MDDRSLTVLVLGGGPDRERAVSLVSAAAVAAALREAGHAVVERDVLPDDLAALDEACDVVFPVLHGAWGEGGPLQRVLAERRLLFVGCYESAAALAMDKLAAKARAAELGVATPAGERLNRGDAGPGLDPPLVLKPIAEGSSFGVLICHDREQVQAGRRALHEQHAALMAEPFIAGREMTVGVVAGEALPVLEIQPAAGFYDYQAKYDRDDTRYSFEIDRPAEALSEMQTDAVTVFRGLGCRDLARVDFIVDDAGRHWFLEINTMPGFTGHSLLPMAAARAGMAMPALCDRLVRLAHERGGGR